MGKDSVTPPVCAVCAAKVRKYGGRCGKCTRDFCSRHIVEWKDGDSQVALCIVCFDDIESARADAPQYPIFLNDRDHYMTSLNSTADLNYTLEPIDAEDDEYAGWDSIGRPVRLHLEHERIVARRTTSDHPEMSKLLAAIRLYAEKYGDPTQVSPEAILHDPVLLFLWADANVEKQFERRRLLNRLRRFWRSIFHS